MNKKKKKKERKPQHPFCQKEKEIPFILISARELIQQLTTFSIPTPLFSFLVTVLIIHSISQQIYPPFLRKVQPF